MPTFVPEGKVETLYSDTRTVPEFERGYLKKGVFTLVSSEYRSRAPFPGSKCERCLIGSSQVKFYLNSHRIIQISALKYKIERL